MMGYVLVKGDERHEVGNDRPVYDAQYLAWRAPSGNFSDPDQSWRVEFEGELVESLPLLTPMTLYMAFTPAERIAIKASKDPMVQEFWAMYELSVKLNKPTDPNLVSVRDAIGYLAAPVEPGPGAGILTNSARVDEILQGIPQ
ncbi:MULTISPECIES: hypothetical protein [unclassified Duganella]|uniref:hypothetical protein n=1 Tax=unclassified Duganella TaxID=2636909 RepID=UPI0008829A1A|nr:MULTISPECIES: hypothetical protein [unclassified Duganella]SDH06465.1 hypothetical protein SAMN05216320_109159 [Duganella sp. OV458]SDK19623.1 hypothetical protein SAMN05428973_109123 [Duganella sp. OV510]